MWKWLEKLIGLDEPIVPAARDQVHPYGMFTGEARCAQTLRDVQCRRYFNHRSLHEFAFPYGNVRYASTEYCNKANAMNELDYVATAAEQKLLMSSPVETPSRLLAQSDDGRCTRMFHSFRCRLPKDHLSPVHNFANDRHVDEFHASDDFLDSPDGESPIPIFIFDEPNGLSEAQRLPFQGFGGGVSGGAGASGTWDGERPVPPPGLGLPYASPQMGANIEGLGDPPRGDYVTIPSADSTDSTGETVPDDRSNPPSDSPSPSFETTSIDASQDNSPSDPPADTSADTSSFTDSSDSSPTDC